MSKTILLTVLFLAIAAGCKDQPQGEPALPDTGGTASLDVKYARGFEARTDPQGITYLTIRNPWPGASKEYNYALVPREKLPAATFPANAYDAVIPVPVERLVLTSTTHIPALEILDATGTLVGFPGLDYISSPAIRKRIEAGSVSELGANEHLNTEMVLAAEPEVVVGFGVSDAPGAYRPVSDAGIPVIFNGDWMEQNPLGKAEWVKFFGLLLDAGPRASEHFREVERAYLEARDLAAGAPERPTVLSGALYRDIWYLPGGESWAAAFIEDANAEYLWKDTSGGGSLSLSLEAVLDKGAGADFWIAPAQFTSYTGMEAANPHYRQFRAFRQRRIFGYAATRGPGKGLLYYEMAPTRPDWVLKDLIHFLHPGLLPDYQPVFFKPLDP